MNDSASGDSTRRSIRLVPGVIYEWTPDGITPAPEDDSILARFSATSFRVGDEPVPGYRLAERIGRGCTGEVWEAIGPGGVAVALKFVEAGQKGTMQELRALAAMPEIRHANLVTLFGIWERDDWTAIGMDLADGSLLDRCEAARAAGRFGLGPEEAIDLLRQAARGIDFLNEPRHALAGDGATRLVHRDIKPQNLLVVGASVKVGDFGLVCRPNVASGFIPGVGGEAIESLVTAYSAPEVRRGDASARSDQYSLAATYCYLRGGRPPNALLGPDDPIDLAMLPPVERSAVARALATDPARRWPSCAALVEALAAATGEGGVTPLPPATLAPSLLPILPAGPPAEPWLLSAGRAVTVTAGLLALAGLTWFTLPITPEVPTAAAIRAPKPISPPEPTQPHLTMERSSATPPPPEPARALEAVVEAESEAAPPPTLADADLVTTAATAPPTEPSPPEVPGAVEEPGVAEEPAPVPVDLPAEIGRWAVRSADRVAHKAAALRPLVARGLAALPLPATRPASVARPVEPPLPRTATIIVRLPNSKAELVVRGEVGRGNPDEWYGQRRVVHSPPLATSQDYLIGAFWTDPDGRQQTRSQPLTVEPGRRYEVDLRATTPTVAEIPRTPAP